MGHEVLPLRALTYFLAVARTGSMTAAAKELGVTPSAMSHQLKSLETWLGGPVLDRGTRALHLTPVGRILRDGTDANIAQAVRVMTGMREAAAPGRLVVSAPPAFAALRLPLALEVLRKRDPDAHLDIRTKPFDAAVETDVVHIAIRFRHQEGEGRRLGQRGWSAVCSPECFAKLGHPAHVRDITGAVLAHERIFNFWPERLDGTTNVAPSLSFLPMDDVLAVVGAAMSGAAVGLVPREIGRVLWREGALVAIPGGDVEPAAAFYAILTEAGMLKPGINELFEELAAAFE